MSEYKNQNLLQQQQQQREDIQWTLVEYQVYFGPLNRAKELDLVVVFR